MDIEASTDSSSPPHFTPPPPEGVPGKIFFKEEGGLRAGWRLLVYATFVLGIEFGGGIRNSKALGSAAAGAGGGVSAGYRSGFDGKAVKRRPTELRYTDLRTRMHTDQAREST